VSRTDLSAPAPPHGGGGVHPPEPDGQRPVRPAGPSTKWAALVLGIVGVIFVGGLILLGIEPNQAPTSAPTSITTAPGAPLRAEVSSSLLRPMVQGGQPPADILRALALPAGSTVVPHSLKDHGVELYDYSLGLTVPASQSQVVAFFKDQLRADGWTQMSSGHVYRGSGIEVLGQHASVTGTIWQLGIVVDPTRPATTSGPTRAFVTPYTVELYVQSLTD
jgi:hypothetical protein